MLVGDALPLAKVSERLKQQASCLGQEATLETDKQGITTGRSQRRRDAGRLISLPACRALPLPGGRSFSSAVRRSDRAVTSNRAVPGTGTRVVNWLLV